LVREAIEAEPYRIGPRISKLRRLLAKLDPASGERAATPYPAPKPRAAWTLPGNGASDRVLEKAGFRNKGTLRQKAHFKNEFHDFRMFGRIAVDPPERPEAHPLARHEGVMPEHAETYRRNGASTGLR
jgi:hypothetical protein